MSRIWHFALALGLAVVGPSIASADLPTAVWAENVNPRRDQLRRYILGLRSMLEQTKCDKCGVPPGEVAALEQAIRQLEAGYIRGRPVTIKSPPLDTRREKK